MVTNLPSNGPIEVIKTMLQWPIPIPAVFPLETNIIESNLFKMTDSFDEKQSYIRFRKYNQNCYNEPASPKWFFISKKAPFSTLPNLNQRNKEGWEVAT